MFQEETLVKLVSVVTIDINESFFLDLLYSRKFSKNIVIGLELYLKRDSGTGVNFAKFLRTPFLQNTSG